VTSTDTTSRISGDGRAAVPRSTTHYGDDCAGLFKIPALLRHDLRYYRRCLPLRVIPPTIKPPATVHRDIRFYRALLFLLPSLPPIAVMPIDITAPCFRRALILSDFRTAWAATGISSAAIHWDILYLAKDGHITVSTYGRGRRLGRGVGTPAGAVWGRQAPLSMGLSVDSGISVVRGKISRAQHILRLSRIEAYYINGTFYSRANS